MVAALAGEEGAVSSVFDIRKEALRVRCQARAGRAHGEGIVVDVREPRQRVCGDLQQRNSGTRRRVPRIVGFRRVF